MIGPAGPLSVRVYRPSPGLLHPVLFLHGGGFVIGGDGYDAPLRELALSSGCLIVSPECRLAPEHPFPAAVEDALAMARWLNVGALALGASSSPPAVAGDSSGGNLAAVVTHALTREGARPSFQVLIYPMLDATASSASYEEFSSGYGFSSEKSRWYFDQYLSPGLDRRTPRVSPLFDRGLGDLPATLIVTAECDPLRDDGERHAESLREVGVQVELRRYDGMIHGFFQMTGALEAHDGCTVSSANGCVGTPTLAPSAPLAFEPTTWSAGAAPELSRSGRTALGATTRRPPPPTEREEHDDELRRTTQHQLEAAARSGLSRGRSSWC